MTPMQYRQRLERLVELLRPVLRPDELEYVRDFLGQAEPDLALDAAAWMIIERQRPITREIHDLFVELLPEAHHAGPHDLGAMEKLVTLAGN